HQFHVQHRPVLGYQSQLLLVARIAPGMRHVRRTDHPFAESVIALQAADASLQCAAHNLMSFLLPRMDVLGHRESWGKCYFDAQQLPICFLRGLKETDLSFERRMSKNVSGSSHRSSNIEDIRFVWRHTPRGRGER